MVDFWAPWWPVNFAPVFKDVADERRGKVRFVKVNTEAEPALSTRFRIRSIPTIMLFKNGEMVDMLNGDAESAIQRMARRITLIPASHALALFPFYYTGVFPVRDVCLIMPSCACVRV